MAPPQDAVHDVGVRSQPRRLPGQPLARERLQTLAHVLRGGDQDRAQLIEGSGARLRGAAALEQKQAQVLAPTAPAGKAQALAGEQAARGEGSVDQIALAPPALLAARALALVDADASLLQEADAARADHDAVWRRQVRAARQLLGTKPAPGRVTVLVTHGSVVGDATGLTLAEGETLVFRPLGGSSFRLVGRILPRAWAALRSG